MAMHARRGSQASVWPPAGRARLNLVTAIADAKMDSIPLIALTGQVGTPVIGSDAFQETPIVEVCRGITKHHYLVTNVNDIARVMREAFHIAVTGRPGPVLVDVPKNIQVATVAPNYDVPMNLPGYQVENRLAKPEQIAQVAAAIKQSKRPVIYAGGGILASNASEELRELVHKTGIPITTTVMGLGAVRADDPLFLDMLGMHGSVYANYAVDQCDLLIALGVRFDDRVTGNKEEFAKHAFIVHIDVDASELNKNKQAHIPIISDVRYALKELNKIVERPEGIEPWIMQINEWKRNDPFKYDKTLRWDPAAARHCRAIAHYGRREHDHHRWRRSAPDVGRTILQVHEPADLAVELWSGDDGFRSAGRDGRQGGISRPAGCGYRRRRQLPDEHPGTGDLLLRKAAGQGAPAQQSAPGHGRAVGRSFLQREPRSYLPRADRQPRSKRAGERTRTGRSLS